MIHKLTSQQSSYSNILLYMGFTNLHSVSTLLNFPYKPTSSGDMCVTQNCLKNSLNTDFK